MSRSGFLERVLRKVLPGGPLYVRVARRELSVRDTSTRKEWRQPAAVAICRDDESVVAAGQEAVGRLKNHVKGVDLVWPFDHPRCVLANFLLTERLLQFAVHSLYSSRWLLPSPVILIHPIERFEGGLTDLELRALRELAAGAGAREALVWQGRELHDTEVGDERFTVAA